MLRDDRRRKNAQPFGGDGAAVIDEIDVGEQALHPLHIAAVCFLELNSFGKVVEIAADHVVAANDLVPAMYECVSEVTAEEPSDARDKNFHSKFV